MSRRERLPEQEGILIKIGICFAERAKEQASGRASEREEIHRKEDERTKEEKKNTDERK